MPEPAPTNPTPTPTPEPPSLVNEKGEPVKAEPAKAEPTKEPVKEASEAEPVKVEPPVALEAKDIVIPEGYEVDEPTMKQFVDLLNNREMSPKDLANKLVELQINQQKTASEKGSQEFADLMKSWRDQVQADPDIGGNKWNQNSIAIGRMLDKYGSPEARLAFDATGAGNNPHVIKMLIAMSKDLPISEGKFVPSGGAGQGERTAAQILYPNQGKT